MNIPLLAAILALAISTAGAQSLERLSVSAGGALAKAAGEALAPLQARDIFREFQDECGIVDAKMLRLPDLTEAVEALEPCFQKISADYRVPISVRSGLVKTEADPTAGIILLLPDASLEQRALARSLGYSLSLRSGSLLGYQAQVLLRDDSALAASHLQQAIDRCVQPMVLRDIDSGADFVRYYGRCVVEEPGLKVKEIRPAQGQRLAVTVLSSADPDTVDALNGIVSVPGRAGEVRVLVVAYPETIYLP
ncbi:MAG: hypothetical protein HY921_07185 [Elusimicrobia bacterium]|nr:hypothetical protein [Elusimicrobiota bacterium]